MDLKFLQFKYCPELTEGRNTRIILYLGYFRPQKLFNLMANFKVLAIHHSLQASDVEQIHVAIFLPKQ